MGDNEKHNHMKIKIGVSGAAETGHCGLHALDAAKELGREIVRQGAILVSGATSGFPFWTAMGAKEAGGISLGLSPAATEREHTEVYRLPLDYMDLIVYTGFGYAGRDILFTRSCDAVVIGCGRIGTIHEFTIAFEDGRPVGILEGEWGTGQTIRDIIARGNRPADHIIFDTDPKKLVARLIEMVKKHKVEEYEAAPSRPYTL